MPLPWPLNEWSLNPWGGDPEREAAADTEGHGNPGSTRLADWLPEPTPVAHPDDWSPAQWHDVLVQDWPDVISLMDPDDQVFRSDDDRVMKFLKSVGIEKDKTRIQCFDRAWLQLDVGGYRPSNNPATDSRSILMLREVVQEGTTVDKLQVDKMIEAVDYLKSTLSDGAPVLIGLRLNLYPRRPNDRMSTPEVEPTNHYVVAVGAGQDDDGYYISYFDYLKRYSSESRLYLKPTMLMESSYGFRTLTEIRRSRPRPAGTPRF